MVKLVAISFSYATWHNLAVCVPPAPGSPRGNGIVIAATVSMALNVSQSNLTSQTHFYFPCLRKWVQLMRLKSNES